MSDHSPPSSAPMAPPPESPRNGPAMPPAVTSSLLLAGRALMKCLTLVADYARKVIDYYWSQRVPLKAYFTEQVFNLAPAGNRQREIQLATDDNVPGAEFGSDGWKIKMPDCCIVCGGRSSREWETQVTYLENLGAPIWAPVIGTTAGLLLSVLFWTRWMLPVGIVAGFVLGYRSRSQTRVEVRFRRCTRDSENQKFPRLRLLSELLVLRVGDPSVRQRFLGLQVQVVPTGGDPLEDGDTGGEVADGTAPADAPPAAPQSIPLAEESFGTVQFDERPRLAPEEQSSGDAEIPAAMPAPPPPALPALSPYSQEGVIPAQPVSDDEDVPPLSGGSAP